MNFRTKSLALFALAAIAAGCGDPTPAKFVDGKLTEALHPQAAANVRLEVEKKFGTPREIVAAMQFSNDNGLPIDFGRIEGTVASTETELKDHQIAVEFTRLGGLKPDEVARLGLTFTSGDYQNATYEAEKADDKRGIKKGPNAVFFSVLDYRPSADDEKLGILSLNYKLNKGKPPALGDTFVLVGHRLRAGRRLYRQHCMHCHGYSGDGNGRTAKYLNPRPRDYRLGEFKFTSTRAKVKASRADLQHIVKKGIPGTYMPSFLMMFDDQESADVVEYVRWLALRGEYERYLGLAFLANEFSKDGWDGQEEPEKSLSEFLTDDFDRKIEENGKALIATWSAPQKSTAIVRPTKKRHPMTAASIARGRALYLSSKTTDCLSCHGVSARGDGPQTTKYQKLQGDLLLLAPPNSTYPEPGLYDMWGNRLKPRDLTKGIYRGGRRPIDLYRRIKMGIKGTPMPSFATLTDEQIWDLVNYVLSVPLAKNGTLPTESKRVAHAAQE